MTAGLLVRPDSKLPFFDASSYYCEACFGGKPCKPCRENEERERHRLLKAYDALARVSKHGTAQKGGGKLSLIHI